MLRTGEPTPTYPARRPHIQLTGVEVTGLCEKCFDLGNKTGCETTHFCPEETGYPWCADKQMACDALGPDKLTGVTATMGRGCCKKYAEDNTGAACGGMPCPDDQAAEYGASDHDHLAPSTTATSTTSTHHHHHHH